MSYHLMVEKESAIFIYYLRLIQKCIFIDYFISGCLTFLECLLLLSLFETNNQIRTVGHERDLDFFFSLCALTVMERKIVKREALSPAVAPRKKSSWKMASGRLCDVCSFVYLFTFGALWRLVIRVTLQLFVSMYGHVRFVCALGKMREKETKFEDDEILRKRIL